MGKSPMTSTASSMSSPAVTSKPLHGFLSETLRNQLVMSYADFSYFEVRIVMISNNITHEMQKQLRVRVVSDQGGELQ